MITRYSHADIEKWADYSGDRNIVHFDKAYAIKSGLKDIIVQGMLILLDTKMMIASHLNDSVSIDFFIKRPVSINTDVEYDITAHKNKKVLTVIERDNRLEPCVTATILPQKPPVLKNSAGQIRVSSEFIQPYLRQLQASYPDVTHNWLLMDTLLFSLSFNQQKNDYFHRQSLKILDRERYKNITTYHVAQRLFISKRLLSCDNIQYADLSYLIEERDVYSQADSAYSTFNISAIEHDEIIFQSSIGCMTKASR